MPLTIDKCTAVSGCKNSNYRNTFPKSNINWEERYKFWTVHSETAGGNICPFSTWQLILSPSNYKANHPLYTMPNKKFRVSHLKLCFNIFVKYFLLLPEKCSTEHKKVSDDYF